MSRVCALCEKKPNFGRHVKRRGMARRKGGAGRKITGVSHRLFKPNIQRIKITTPQGTKHILICAKCLKAGKIKKAVQFTGLPSNQRTANP